MKKKILSVIMVVLIVFLSFPVYAGNDGSNAASAATTATDMVELISSQTTALVSTYVNKYNQQTLNEQDIDKTIFYVEVCELSDSELSIDSIAIGSQEYLLGTTYKFGIGNNAFIESPVWLIENNKLLVALPWLCAEAIDAGCVTVTISDSHIENIRVFSMQESSQLSITNVGVLGNRAGYVNNAVLSGENEITHTFGHGSNYVGVTLSVNGEELIASDTPIFRKAPSGGMAIVTPASGYTYTLYPKYSTKPIENTETFEKDYTLVVPEYGSIKIHFVFNAQGYAAKIGDAIYATLGEAITAANTMTNAQITVMNDCGTPHTTAEAGTRYCITAPMTIKAADQKTPEIYGSLCVELPNNVTEPVVIEGLEVVHSGVYSPDHSKDEKCGVLIRNGSVSFKNNTIRLLNPLCGDLPSSPVAMQISKLVDNTATLSYDIIGNTFGAYNGYSTKNGTTATTFLGMANDKATSIYGLLDPVDWDMLYANNTFDKTSDQAIGVFNYKTFKYEYAVVYTQAGLDDVNAYLMDGLQMNQQPDGSWISGAIPATYAVTFLSDGLPIDEVTVTQGDTVDKPTDPTKDGWDFKGWMLDGAIYDFSTPINSELTLIALWEKSITQTEYDVYFISDGEPIDLVTLKYGQLLLEPETPAKEGYIFLGWYLDNSPYDFSTPVTSEITLEAMWKLHVLPSINSDKISTTHNTKLTFNEEQKIIKATYESADYATLNFCVLIENGETLTASGGEAKILYNQYYSITNPSESIKYTLTITDVYGGSTEYTVVVEDQSNKDPEIIQDEILKMHNTVVEVDTENKIIKATYESIEKATINFRVKLTKFETLTASGEGAKVLYSSYYSISNPVESGDYRLTLTNTKGVSVEYKVVIEDKARPLPVIDSENAKEHFNATLQFNQSEKIIYANCTDSSKKSINFKLLLDKDETVTATGGELVGRYYTIRYPKRNGDYSVTITNLKGTVTYSIKITGLPEISIPVIEEKVDLRYKHNTDVVINESEHRIDMSFKDASYATANFAVKLGEGETLTATGKGAYIDGNYFCIKNPSDSVAYTLTITNRYGDSNTYQVSFSYIDLTHPTITQEKIGETHNTTVTVSNDTIFITYDSTDYSTVNFELKLTSGEKITASGNSKAAILYGKYFRVMKPSVGEEYLLTITNGSGVSTTYTVKMKSE